MNFRNEINLRLVAHFILFFFIINNFLNVVDGSIALMDRFKRSDDGGYLFGRSGRFKRDGTVIYYIFTSSNSNKVLF